MEKSKNFYGTIRTVKPHSTEIKRGTKLIFNNRIVVIDDQFKIGFDKSVLDLFDKVYLGKPVLNLLDEVYLLQVVAINTEVPDPNKLPSTPFLPLSVFPLHLNSWEYAVKHNLIDAKIAVPFEMLEGEYKFYPTTYDQPDLTKFVKYDTPVAKILEYKENLFSEYDVANMVYDLVRNNKAVVDIKSLDDARKYVLNNTKKYESKSNR